MRNNLIYLVCSESSLFHHIFHSVGSYGNDPGVICHIWLDVASQDQSEGSLLQNQPLYVLDHPPTLIITLISIPFSQCHALLSVKISVIMKFVPIMQNTDEK